MSRFISKFRELPSLPPELWAMAMAHLDQKSKKQFRLSCKEFCAIATPSIFETVCFDLDADGVDNLLAIADHNELRKHVRTLVLQRRQALVPVSFDAWQDVLACAERELEDNYLAEECGELTRHYDDKGISVGAYLSVSTCTLQRQHNDYKSDHVALAQRTHQLIACTRLHAPGLLSSADSPPVQGNGPPAPPATPDRLDRFDAAIARLPHLRSFAHVPLFTPARHYRLRWRSHRLAFGPLVRSTHRELPAADRHAEALHLALALRALGLAARAGSSLRHLAFAPGSLGRLWGWQREESPGAERTARFARELATMGAAVAGLERLDAGVEAGDGRVAVGLLDMLRRARGVEGVRLVLGPGPDAVRAARLAGDVLGGVAEARCWPKVRRVELVGATVGRECLLGFLRTPAGSLRELVLKDCFLGDFELGGARYQGWEDVFKGLAEDLRLDAVELCDLSDRPSTGSSERSILKPSAWQWLQLSGCYRYYETSVYDHILGRSQRLPVIVPEDFLGDHFPVCEQARASIVP